MQGKKQKKGWLVVNGNLQTEKFKNLYTLLQNSARKQGVSLALKTGDELVFPVGEKIDLPNFAIFWDKDIPLARNLESLGLRLFNTRQAVEICDDKILTSEALVKNGVPTPTTIVAPKTFENIPFRDYGFLEKAEKILGYPMVIKEANGSFGAQVYLAQDRKQAEEIIEKIGYKPFIMQRFIAESYGKDIRVNIVGGKVVCAMLRSNPNDFRSNISGGGKGENITLTKEQEEIALQACKAVKAEFCGVDLLFSKDGPLVCEVNSNPQFRSTLDATGVDLAEYIIEYIGKRI